MDTPTAPPAERAPWPSHCARPEEILEWLNKLQAKDGLTGRCLLGMRWLVLAELDRTVPEPAPRAVPAFTPNLFGTPLAPDAGLKKKDAR
jgi:hypothetical protein